MTEKPSQDLVVGASSAIASALIAQWAREAARPIIAISRSVASEQHLGVLDGVSVQHSDYSDASLESITEGLLDADADINRLVICNGVLQGEGYRPERALNQLEGRAMADVFEANTFTPMRVLAALSPVLKRSTAPRIAVLSARVGSIGDNQLGGWYSYRGSKAALNMMLKCAALELRRLNPEAKLIAYHPGTVDTPLSKPFQGNVDPQTLQTPEHAAAAFDRVLSEAEVDGELGYLDWRGETIVW